MIVEVHRSEVVLLKGDDRLTIWHEYAFDPLGLTASSRGNGCSVVRYASKLVRIRTSPLCRLNAEGTRLITAFNPWGLDARSVHHLATKAEDHRGFALADGDLLNVKSPEGPPAGGESFDPKPSPGMVAPAPPVPPWLDPPEPAGVLTPVNAPARWGIAFRSAAGYMSWLAQLGSGPHLYSTLDLRLARTWPDREGCSAHFDQRGLSPARAIQVGWGVHPSIEPIPADGVFPRGVAFEILPRAGLPEQPSVAPARPSAGPAPVIAELPAAQVVARPKSGRDLPGQGMFSFTG